MTDDDGVHADASQEDDAAYFRRRAAWHERRAKVAQDMGAQSLHLRFAKLYRARSES